MPPLNCIISISLELYRRSWECFAKREQQSNWGTVQWPDENATRGVVGPSPQRCPWSQWSRILDFGRAFEVCLSETWQWLQATGQRRQELMFKPGLHLWIGMDSFFLFRVQWTSCFILSPLTPSPDHYSGLWKGSVCLLHTHIAQNNKKINGIPRSTTIYSLPSFNVIFSLQF